MLSQTAGVDAGSTSRVAPLLLLRAVASSSSEQHLEVLTCTRMREIGLVFTRVGSLALPAQTPVLEKAREALALARPWNERIAGEANQYFNFEPETEVEAKITVESLQTPWDLASHLAAVVSRGDLRGFIPDVGTEFQRWQHHQDTFEITGPANEVGYFAFLPKPEGSFLLKHKTFAHDALRRREVFKFDVTLPEGTDFEGYLKETFPRLTVRRLPHLVRTRFDVNVESTQTGHFYGIEVDEVVVEGYPQTLRQVEIEYHHSRRHEGLSRDSIEPELLGLEKAVRSELDALGVTCHSGFYSKLSFLKDTIASRPACQETPAV
ncbi:hypothetical protein ACIQJT_35125 [Streptomyces sp. NPDC091972]|uniref:hypothetical protein n=1 Tax=Streptomyces sp. NPDC091972 TaxID=3366007 RepID=UPI003815919E